MKLKFVHSRDFYIKTHLTVAAFLTPMLVLMAISGGLYLLGIKGTIRGEEIQVPAGVSVNLESASLEDDVRGMLSDLSIEHDFEYLKIDGSTLYTRPTSRLHYQISVSDDAVNLQRNHPSIQKRLIELHKGHGPGLFKNYQKVMAVGLVYIVLNGVLIGLMAANLRRYTLIVIAAGILVFAVAAFLV